MKFHAPMRQRSVQIHGGEEHRHLQDCDRGRKNIDAEWHAWFESTPEIPKVPTIFNKFATSIIGPGEKIVLPKKSEKPDYEAEMALIIGKGGRYSPEDKWQDHVFGYTILNDVSARDYQLATTQWLMGK